MAARLHRAIDNALDAETVLRDARRGLLAAHGDLRTKTDAFRSAHTTYRQAILVLHAIIRETERAA